MVRGLYVLLLAFVASSLAASTFRQPPYTIGHRGACGVFPEHTMGSYKRAVEDGADFVECDIVPTKDCVLICRHEPELNLTTNAAQYFSNKVATYEIDGANVTGIFSFDLTWKEIQQLRANQPRTYRNQMYNGMYPLVSLDQYIDFIQSASRPVGIYPETKHPTFFDSLGLKCFANTTFSDAVLKALVARGYTGPINSPAWLQKPIFIQSFERKNLMKLKNKTNIPLIMLVDEWDLPVPYDDIVYGDLTTAAGLEEVATFAAGMGPWKTSYAPVNASNFIEDVDVDFIKNAHAAGLQLHPYTFRNEEIFLAWDFEGDINKE